MYPPTPIRCRVGRLPEYLTVFAMRRMAIADFPARPGWSVILRRPKFAVHSARSIAVLLEDTRPITARAAKNGRADPLPFSYDLRNSRLLLVDSLLQFGPGSKLRDFAGSDFNRRAGLWIASVACFSRETEKVPKPINATRSPLRRAEVMLSTAVSMAVVACALLISHAPAILSTRSALFIVSPRRFRSFPADTGRKYWLWLSWET